MDDFAECLLPALEAVCKPTRLSASATDRKQIEQVLLLLDSAIAQCSTRKDQIAPLINALKVVRDNAVKP